MAQNQLPSSLSSSVMSGIFGYKNVLGLFVLAAFIAFTGCQDSKRDMQSDTSGAGDINEFTPIVMSTIAPPVPVTGSDGLYHFAYELMLSNSNNFDWELLSAEVLDGSREGKVLYSIAGKDISGDLQQIGTRTSITTLEPAQSALLFIEFAVEDREKLPKRLLHRLTLTVPGGLPDKITSLLQLFPRQHTLTAIGAPTEVSRQPVVVLSPPLEGAAWVAANGCCDAATHVRAALPINGKIHISQRFAIDWMKIDDEHRLYEGDPQRLENWFGYDQKVLAAADGMVVTVVDKFSNQKPFVLPADTGAITLEEIDGNHIILALGNGQYAFYAHLKPGSLQVKVGDKVKQGQPLALLGNTGNTGAPHLHFHIMQSGSSLGSNGLPYVFKEFELQGKTTEKSFFDSGLEDNTPFVDEKTGLIEGNAIEILPLPDPGVHREELPLNLTVVGFPQGD